jgi:hypothetical protein
MVMNLRVELNNYYLEFVVWPSMNLFAGSYDTSVEPYSGVAFPGPMRLLIGAGGEVYFTGDHYGSDGFAADHVNPVPEPSTIALLTLGALGLLARGRYDLGAFSE